MSKQPPPTPTASSVGPCPTVIQTVGRPGPGRLSRTIPAILDLGRRSKNDRLLSTATPLTCNNSTLAAKTLRWSGGAVVLAKLPVPGRPTIWITVGQGPTALKVDAGRDCLDILLSSILSLLFLPLFGRRPDID